MCYTLKLTLQIVCMKNITFFIAFPCLLKGSSLIFKIQFRNSFIYFDFILQKTLNLRPLTISPVQSRMKTATECISNTTSISPRLRQPVCRPPSCFFSLAEVVHSGAALQFGPVFRKIYSDERRTKINIHSEKKQKRNLLIIVKLFFDIFKNQLILHK